MTFDAGVQALLLLGCVPGQDFARQPLGGLAPLHPLPEAALPGRGEHGCQAESPHHQVRGQTRQSPPGRGRPDDNVNHVSIL